MDYYENPNGYSSYPIDRKTFYSRLRRKNAYIKVCTQNGVIVNKTLMYHNIC